MPQITVNPSIYIVFAIAVAMVVPYRIILGRLKRYIKEESAPQTVLVIHRQIPKLFWLTFVLFLISNTLYRFEIENPYKFHQSLGISCISLLWSVLFTFSMMPILKLQKKLFRSMIWGTLMLSLFYDNLAAWDIIPNIWSASLIFHEFDNTLKVLIYNFLTLYFIVAYLSTGHPILQYMTKKTTATLDDNLLEMIKWPIVCTIFLGAIGYSNSILQLSSFAHHTIHATITTVGIAVWTKAILAGIVLTLNEILKSRQNSAVKKGLLPESIEGIINEQTLPAISLSARVVTVILAMYYVLYAWGIDPTAWLASAGIIGIAVAYASQDTLASLLAGVAIFTDSPYKMNDFLILDDGQRGRVESIGFRSTRIMTPDDVQVVIPNAIMANTKIINISGGGSDYARIDCFAGVAYGTDIDKVRELLHEVSRQMTYTILGIEEMEPQVHFIAMGASSLDFVLRVWLIDPNMYAQAQDEANTLIYKIFTAHGIEIPYTKQDLYLYPGAPIEISNVDKPPAAK